MSLQEKEIDTESQKEWCHVMMELEVGVMNLQAKGRQDGQWPLGAGREAWRRSFLRASRRNQPYSTLVPDF